MNLMELIEALNRLAEDKKNLGKEVVVTGCYGSHGYIFEVYTYNEEKDPWISKGDIILESDICSG